MLHAEVQFRPAWARLGAQHNRQSKEARFKTQQSNNGEAILPAECACYVAHAKALVVARATCIAEAYTSFKQPAGKDAEMD
jgi:hypothetical protein